MESSVCIGQSLTLLLSLVASDSKEPPLLEKESGHVCLVLF